MKKKFAVYLAASILGAFAVAGITYAGEPIYTHGAAFKAWNAGQNNDIDYTSVAVRTTATTSRTVIASIPHMTTSLNNGLGVYVYGKHIGAQSTTCTLYAYNSQGTLMGSKSLTTTANNTKWSLFFPVVGTGSQADWAISAVCTLPANSNGEIWQVVPLAN